MTLPPCRWPLADLLPHRPPMLLIDEVLGYDLAQVHTRTLLRPDHPCAGPGGVAAHALFEVMVQAAAAHLGALLLDQGRPVPMGLLAGVRDFRATQAILPFGAEIHARATEISADGVHAAYDASADVDGIRVASVRITVRLLDAPKTVRDTSVLQGVTEPP